MLLHSDTTEKILSGFYTVYNTLGYGFLEKVYENSLMLEFEFMQLKAIQQATIKVFYNEKEVGNYFADILVDNKVIVEVKAGKGEIKEHELQVSNYLKATNYEVALILHFGERPTFKRVVFSNDYK
ncbi:GxxExxY protein [Ferruginibacter lapsinanis]|uniref:GxxExxY protein n=1 Tax=Ferruginibacter lapsinanis TaxID=563172 RepID=UPI001E28D109|nr:GxxExxY protein [Ferruginibacter lapsinanis]UEG49517.1 GxxExxY protein [Ferruginibacter lapsinanis]